MSPFSGSAPRTEEWRHLRLTREDGVATVTLARPDKLNALTFGAYADLRDLLAELSRSGPSAPSCWRARGAASARAVTWTRSSVPRSPWTPPNSSTSTG